MNYIQTEKKGNVLSVKLNRPDKFNSFNRDMALQLIQVLDEAEKDASVRAIVLTGEGKLFVPDKILQKRWIPIGPG